MRSALRLSFARRCNALGPLMPAIPPAHAQDSDRDIAGRASRWLKHGPRKIAETRTDRLRRQGQRSRRRAAAAARTRSRSARRALGRLVELLGRRRRASQIRDKRPHRVPSRCLRHLLDRNTRGIDGALMDLEYQRMELIKFNLFDNQTYETYVNGGKVNGTADRRLRAEGLEGDAACRQPSELQRRADPRTGDQRCKGPLIRFRTLTGICNDINNPAMGSTGMLFARNVQFEVDLSGSRPRRARAEPPRRAHLAAQAGPAGDQPQAVHARPVGHAELQQGHRARPAADGDCDYKKAPFFNVIAAFWIQFMTHDWFTHMEEARNDRTHEHRAWAARPSA